MSSVVIPASSFTAEFCEGGFDLLRRRETAFGGVAQPAFYAGEFFRRRLIVALSKSGVEVEREVGKSILRLGRPSLDALQNLGQFFGLHGYECTQSRSVVCGRGRESLIRLAARVCRNNDIRPQVGCRAVSADHSLRPDGQRLARSHKR